MLGGFRNPSGGLCTLVSQKNPKALSAVGFANDSDKNAGGRGIGLSQSAAVVAGRAQQSGRDTLMCGWLRRAWLAKGTGTGPRAETCPWTCRCQRPPGTIGQTGEPERNELQHQVGCGDAGGQHTVSKGSEVTLEKWLMGPGLLRAV